MSRTSHGRWQVWGSNFRLSFKKKKKKSHKKLYLLQCWTHRWEIQIRKNKAGLGTCLAVWWLGLCFHCGGARVQSLVGALRSHMSHESESVVARLCLILCNPMDCSLRFCPLSMGFSRQEPWRGLPFSSPGDLPSPGIEDGSPAFQADSLPSEPPRKPMSRGMAKKKRFIK